MITKKFRIGTFVFTLSYPEEFEPAENFLLFETEEDTESTYFYNIELADHLPETEGIPAVTREDIVVLKNGTLENRVLGVKGNPLPYAYYHETDEKHASVVFVKNRMEGLNIDPLFVSLLALERRIVKHDGLILHCAYLDHNGEAVLFSADSGTGKSTQAGLWEKYRPGSRQINGDKALLQKVDGVWTARAWPVCGSSEICRIQDTKIKAVVMLSQAKDNSAARLSPMQAFSLIYPQITCNRWNRKDNIHTMDLLDDLIACIPVWHLACNISEDAVKCLEDSIDHVM